MIGIVDIFLVLYAMFRHKQGGALNEFMGPILAGAAVVGFVSYFLGMFALWITMVVFRKRHES